MTAKVQAIPVRDTTENPLSEREMDVARLLATGASNSEIARELNISPHTVKVHLRNIFEKLEVNSRTEASIRLVQRGWLIIPGMEPELPPLAPEPAPDPEPLADTIAQPTRWQRLYLGVVILLLLAASLAPSFFSSVQPGANLLGDSRNTELSKPSVQESLDPRWEQRTPMLQARSRMAIARVDEQIFIIGGEGADGQQVATVDAYHLRFNTWTPVAPLPHALSNASAAALGEHIYVAGGSYGSAATAGNSAAAKSTAAATVSDTLWRYSVADDSWADVGTLPSPLAGTAIVAAQNALYLFGGWDGAAMRDEVWRLVPLPDDDAPLPNWEVLAVRLAVPRAFLGVAVLEEQIYVVGGFDGQKELDLASVYDPVAGEWRTLPRLSTPRGGLMLASDGQSVFALGGGWIQPIETLERYNPAFDIWSNFPSPIIGEWRNLVAIGQEDEGRISLIGGWGGDYLNLHLEYDSLLRSQMLPLIRND